MKVTARLLAFFVLTLFPWSLALGASPAVEAFARLKALKGEWKTPGEKDVTTVTYEVRADGHAVVETMWDMVTVFHLDGDTILMTHYCSAGNQPRTRATQFASPLTTLDFKFVDVTNAKEGGHYINGLRMELLSENRIRNTWTSEGDHDKPTVVELERK